MFHAGRHYTYILVAFLLFFAGLPSLCHAYTLSFQDIPQVTVSGTTEIMKGTTPGTLKLTSTIVGTLTLPRENLPTTIEIYFSLSRDKTVVKTILAKNVSLTWVTPPFGPTTATINYNFALPAAGATTSTMSTSDDYTANIVLEPATAPVSGRSNSFPYTIYSGSLKFGAIETTYSNLVKALDQTSCASDLLLGKDMAGNWDSGLGIYNFTGDTTTDDICTAFAANSDGYSTDLVVQSGSVDIGNITGETAGIGWQLYTVTLNQLGGQHLYGGLNLGNSASYHPYLNYQVWPTGVRETTPTILPILGSSFTSSVNEISLHVATAAPNRLYFHNPGLPFYASCTGFDFPLTATNTQGIILANPKPYYIHQDAFTSLPDTHPARFNGFASNDAIFRDADLLNESNNTMSINQDGMTGHFEFHANASNIAFPKAHFNHRAFGIDIIDGVLNPQNSILSEPETPLAFSVALDPNCRDKGCGSAASKTSYTCKSDSAVILADGSMASHFNHLGDPDLTDSALLNWGGYDGNDFTFRRQDSDTSGVWVVPGFQMQSTRATPAKEADFSIIHTLLGSHTFTEPGSPELPLEGGDLHLLNSRNDREAQYGNGYFAGINMGPEILYPQPDEGVGSLLTGGIEIRFNGNSSFAAMPDRSATKYTIRKGGVTGVFNTGFNGASDGDVSIYDYNINFSRFSFAQLLNTLLPETFIDGELTLYGPVGGSNGMRVGFTNLALLCDGNLGSGSLDTEPEAEWPYGAEPTGCNGQEGDNDSNTDEACHVLDYWNMPILITGMAFDETAESAQCQPGATRQLHLNTMNKVEGLQATLTLEADYKADGTLANQQMFGEVDTVLDRISDDLDKPGFNFRLQDAYLNQLSQAIPLPAWQGFSVLSGRIDVPLFNDSVVSGHVINQPESAQAIYFFEKAEDKDFDGIQAAFDGTDDDPAAGSVTDFRAYLATNDSAAPKPLFEYSWPSPGIIDLTYRGSYQPAAIDYEGNFTSGQFIGIPRSTNLADVIDVTSVPDYITPKRTKFSFGAQADMEALNNFSFDAGALTSGVASFLENQLGVDLDFDLEGMIGNLTSAEELMNDITGGDITELISDSLDEALKQGVEEGGMAFAITAVVNGLNQAHQAPYMLSAILAEPFEDAKNEILELTTAPELDFSFFAVDVEVPAELDNALAAFIKYDHDHLHDLYDAYTETTDNPVFDDLLHDFNQVQQSIDDLLAKLDAIRDAKENASNFLTNGAGTATTTIDDIINKGTDASEKIHELYGIVTAGLGNYVSNDNSNPIRQKLTDAKGQLTVVRDAIADVHLGDIADALYIASLVAGSPMDVSMLHNAEETANNAVNQLDEVINSADANLEELLNALPLADILLTLNEFLGDDGLLQNSLLGGAYGVEPTSSSGGLIGTLKYLQENATAKVDMLGSDLESLYSMLEALRPSNPVNPETGEQWADVVGSAQGELDAAVNSIYHDLLFQGNAAESMLYEALNKLPERDFISVFVSQVEGTAQSRLELILTAPVNNLLEQIAVQAVIESILEQVVGVLPNPSEEDIRTMIRTAIINQDQIEDINRIFFEQMGFVSDIVDQVATDLIQQINSMVRTAIASINEGLQDQLDEVTSEIGPASWGVASAGIDGYALVSQDEIEKIHLEADFSFGGDPDPTSYNAALDIATWNSGTNESGCSSETANGNIDVAISTHDITAEALGMDVGLREALLGFTMNTTEENIPYPLGFYGRVYTTGELGFESMVLYDLGFEAAVGAYQNYLGATGAGSFSNYNIPKAAFYFGKSCAGNDVLKRLDEEAYEFIGLTDTTLTGVYVRGAVSVPIYNYGCALTIGVGADMGVWYFAENDGTYGGLMGGSAFGQLGCLASLKGAMTLVGQKSGPDYIFHGESWGAAGVGWCSPGKWHSIRDARRDDYCCTGDAKIEVDYINSSLEIGEPDYHCCD